MKLSIIIPTREEEKVIGHTVRYLKEALGNETEIIVSDGKSSDKTVDVARACADHVVLYTTDTPHNASIGRNDGAQVAQGEFFCFLDADVRIPDPKSFFARALRHFENPHVAGVCGPQRAEPMVETWADRLSFGLLNLGIRFQNNILKRGEASGKFMLVRADSFCSIRGFREDLVTREDGDFFKRLSRIGKTIYDPSLMVYHGARRAHKIGWIRLWSSWLSNWLVVALFDRPQAKDWTPVR